MKKERPKNDGLDFESKFIYLCFRLNLPIFNKIFNFSMFFFCFSFSLHIWMVQQIEWKTTKKKTTSSQINKVF